MVSKQLNGLYQMDDLTEDDLELIHRALLYLKSNMTGFQEFTYGASINEMVKDIEAQIEVE